MPAHSPPAEAKLVSLLPPGLLQQRSPPMLQQCVCTRPPALVVARTTRLTQFSRSPTTEQLLERMSRLRQERTPPVAILAYSPAPQPLPDRRAPKVASSPAAQKQPLVCSPLPALVLVLHVRLPAARRTVRQRRAATLPQKDKERVSE